jgi:hypothetical protein
VCETWSHTKGRKQFKGVSEQGTKEIVGPKREEVKGGWKTLQIEALHNLYFSPNITRVIKSRGIRRVRYVARMGEMRNAYKILIGKPESKRSLGRPWRR